MKSVCYTCLLVLIFTGSAEARSFASTLPGEREASILNAKMPTEIAKLQASEKIDASDGTALEEVLEIGDTSFQRVESQWVAQLDKGTKRHDSERLPAGGKKQAEENK